MTLIGLPAWLAADARFSQILSSTGAAISHDMLCRKGQILQGAASLPSAYWVP